MRKITFTIAILFLSIFCAGQAQIGIMLEPLTISGLGQWSALGCSVPDNSKQIHIILT